MIDLIRIHSYITKIFFLGILMLCITTTDANDALDESDCPIVMPDFNNMILLTREERIQLMDQALKDALSQVQDCRQKMSELQTQSSTNATDSDGSDSDSSDGSGDSDNEETDNKDTAGEADSISDGETQQNDNQRQTATPSSDLSGSEAAEQLNASESPTSDEANTPLPTQTATPSSELLGSDPPDPEADSATEQSSDEQPSLALPAVKDVKKALDNGKLPEDIPSVDNDDIIAQQIREAALAEPNPEKQAKLWNEYRRYKGISEK